MPSGNDYVSVQCGTYFGVAMTTNGTLVPFGRPDYGETETPDGEFNDFSRVVRAV